MNSAFWANDFPRLYIGIFEIVFGMFIFAVPQYFSDPKRSFRREMKDPVLGPRFAAVLDRRQAVEALPRTPWRVAGLCGVVLGFFAAFGILVPVVSYALFCLVLALTMTVVFLRMRNRSERRAASLSPRTASSTVAWWLYALTALACLTPLPFLSEPGVGLSAAIVALVSTTLLVTASIASGMAAMLTGEDSEIEMAVEHRIRCGRVSGMLMMATAVPFVFLGMAVPGAEKLTIVQHVAFPTCAGIWFVSFGWLMSRYLRKATPEQRVVVL
jgi:hypothetical protein